MQPMEPIVSFIFLFISLIPYAPEAREHHSHVEAYAAERSTSRLLIKYCLTWCSVNENERWLADGEYANQKEGVTLRGGLETSDGDLSMDTGSYGFGNDYFCLYILLHWFHIHSLN